MSCRVLLLARLETCITRLPCRIVDELVQWVCVPRLCCGLVADTCRRFVFGLGLLVHAVGLCCRLVLLARGVGLFFVLHCWFACRDCVVKLSYRCLVSLCSRLGIADSFCRLMLQVCVAG